MSQRDGFLAIDVGSSRVKIGWFPPMGDCATEKPTLSLPIAASPLTQPDATLVVAHDDQASLWTKTGAWLQEHCPQAPPGYIASVHPKASTLVQELFANRLRVLTAKDLPVETRVEQSERVGIDRLLNAIAVRRIRQPNRAAIVVDLGTACTVDLIAQDGAFEGGAILPGIPLWASALHSGTASLPALSINDFEDAPAAVGKSTQAAIASGLYWGMVGAVRELLGRMGRDLSQSPQVFVTGGGAGSLVEHLADGDQLPRYIPNLVLSGIAAVAEEFS